MKNLIVFGPPGAGKGTQSARIVANYQLVHLSTGELFREALKNQTPVGMEAKAYLDKGLLVPDEVVVQMIREALEAHAGAPGFIFDGFPRTKAQAAALDSLLEDKKAPITHVILLEVPDEELKERLKKRAEISGRSDDADLSIIERRIEVYKAETYPLRDYYAEQGKLFVVKGVGKEDEIADKIQSIIA